MDFKLLVKTLSTARLLPTHTLLQISSTCHSLQDVVDWEDLLKFHFPSHFLMHESTYTKNTEWKLEYTKAYRALTLRYMAGGNLQNSKVLHFGPYLDQEAIEEILDSRGSFFLPKELRNLHNKIPYEGYFTDGYYDGKAYFVDGQDMLQTFDKTNYPFIPHVPPGTEDRFRLSACVNTRSGSLLFCGKTKLNCYDLNTNKKLWDTQLIKPSFSRVIIAVFDQKIFYFCSASLVCAESRTGDVIFQIDHPLTYTDQLVGIQEYADRLVFDGDFAIYLAFLEAGRYLTVVNWKTGKFIHATNMQEIFDIVVPGERGTVTRFAVSNGMLFTNIPDHEAVSRVVGIDLGYSKSKSVLLWHVGHGRADANRIISESIFEPCVYGNMLYTLEINRIVHSKNALPNIIAVNTLTGKIEWTTELFDYKTYPELNAFRDFLSLQFCQENILFYENAIDWKRLPANDPQRISKALEIRDCYILEDGVCQINIGESIREAICAALNQIDIPEDIFDDALNEVLLNMRTNSYYKFKSHPLYATSKA